MRVCNLSSGSDGNSTYIETEQTKVLLDAGLSAVQLEKRLNMLGVCGKDISAIIISHEHNDHIKGIEFFAKKYKTPIYANEKNWRSLVNKFHNINPSQFIAFTEADFYIGDLKVSPIEVPHDAACTCAFSFYENDKKISILTDLGQTNARIINHIQNSRLVYLESNFDEAMLKANPNYSPALKRRILSANGHLSNVNCAETILKLQGVKQVMLSHLSTKNNTKDLAYDTIVQILAEHGIVEGKDIFIGVTDLVPTAIFKIK